MAASELWVSEAPGRAIVCPRDAVADLWRGALVTKDGAKEKKGFRHTQV